MPQRPIKESVHKAEVVMANEKEILMSCEEFEDHISDYLDKALDGVTQKAVAAHAMMCPLCHSLLNDIKDSISVCRTISATDRPLTRLEADILARTMPDAGMHCDEFESFLTDYLDGFLPAQLFHRWERHAAVCDECTDLPGAVVRTLASLVTFKMEELAVPSGLNERIIAATLKTRSMAAAQGASFGRSWAKNKIEWLRSIRLPIAIPQLAPVAMMLLFAFLVISQAVSADGSFADVYTKSYQIAEEGYRQSTEAFSGSPQITDSMNQNHPDAPLSEHKAGTTDHLGGKE